MPGVREHKVKVIQSSLEASEKRINEKISLTSYSPSVLLEVYVYSRERKLILISKKGNKMIDHYTCLKENEDYLPRELQLKGKRRHVLRCAV